MTAIIDYGAGNVQSVKNAFAFLGEDCILTDDRDKILACDRVVLPGVGSFGAAMDRLRSKGLDAVISEVVDRKMPFLGICLGLQVLFEESEESPGVKGLSLLKGKIVRIPTGEGIKIPHIGWNSLCIKRDSRILNNLGENPYVYFVHSYYLKAENEEDVSANTVYSAELNIAAEKDNLFAVQFHPEKSGKTGLAILKNFLEVK